MMISTNKKSIKIEQSESGRQFEEIWREHHDHETRGKKRLEKNRVEKANKVKNDSGC